MDRRPIGVFDSGLGGLTAVKELRRLLPNENIVYFGDTGRVPYGTRSRETIIKYANEDIAFLRKHNVKMIISACATVSSTISFGVGDGLDIPFTGVIDPASKAAAAATINGKIGVMGTPATIKLGEFTKAIHSYNPSAEVISNACPLLVPIVENGYVGLDNEIARLAIEMYIAPLKEAGVDTVILGCTHYPILFELINRAFGGKVRLIDSGKETAIYAKEYLTQNGKLSLQGGHCEYYVSDSVQGFTQTANLFLGQEIEGVTKIEFTE